MELKLEWTQALCVWQQWPVTAATDMRALRGADSGAGQLDGDGGEEDYSADSCRGRFSASDLGSLFLSDFTFVSLSRRLPVLSNKHRIGSNQHKKIYV